MLVGVPREIKDNEFRVGMTPAAIDELVHHGHRALVEKGAGIGSGSPDEEYARAGAELVGAPEEIFARADMIVKVKEPLASERKLLRPGQILFTYLHLAPDLPQTRDLVASGATCIAYETVTDSHGGLPLLTPMSEVAGRLAPQVGAHALEKAQGGRGVLLGGVPGVAAAMCSSSGAASRERMPRRSRSAWGRPSPSSTGRTRLCAGSRRSSALRCARSIRPAPRSPIWSAKADLVIGAVLLPGAAAPKLITRAMLATMRPGAVIVDVAIDQGGCCETSRPTTHSNPTYVVDGIVHYCVANMPGAVARTSTFALNHATLPFTLALADKGWRKALADDPHLRAGLNVQDGKVTCEPVAAAHGLPFVSAESVLAS